MFKKGDWCLYKPCKIFVKIVDEQTDLLGNYITKTEGGHYKFCHKNDLEIKD